MANVYNATLTPVAGYNIPQTIITSLSTSITNIVTEGYAVGQTDAQIQAQLVQYINYWLMQNPSILTVSLLENGSLYQTIGATPVLGDTGINYGTVVASFTRPANTTAYASGYLIANSTTAGSVVPLSLPVARKLGAAGKINRVRLSSSNPLASTAVMRVHLYMLSPTTTAGDGAAWSAATNGVSAEHIGYMDVTYNQVFSDGAKGDAIPETGAVPGIIFDTSNATANIYALLEARGSYTPLSGEVYTLTLELERN